MKSKALVIILILLLLGGGCLQRRTWTQGEAERLAMTALEKYAAKEKIPVSKFRASPTQKTYFDKEAGVWVVYYESESRPQHRVSVLVDAFGNTEIHREMEEP